MDERRRPRAPGACDPEIARYHSGPHRVRLTWSHASDNVGVTGYRIYRNGTVLTSSSVASYTDDAVSRKTTYRYAVRALDAAGNLGAQSATVYVTTR